MKNKLADLQTTFLAGLSDDDAKTSIVSKICDTDSLSASQRFEIYQDSIEQSLMNAITEIYPVCQKLVGEEFFAGYK